MVEGYRLQSETWSYKDFLHNGHLLCPMCGTPNKVLVPNKKGECKNCGIQWVLSENEFETWAGTS